MFDWLLAVAFVVVGFALAGRTNAGRREYVLSASVQERLEKVRAYVGLPSNADAMEHALAWQAKLVELHQMGYDLRAYDEDGYFALDVAGAALRRHDDADGS